LLEPFDFEPEEPDRRAVDFDFVWAMLAVPFFPWQPRGCNLLERPATRCCAR
jgi:hypothetical protein